MTTVHAMQVVEVFPADPHDLPVAVIATPDRCFEVPLPPEAPSGIDWDRLSPDDMEAMPILKSLRDLRMPARPKTAS